MTMNIQVMSDLHFEFHRDAGCAFVDSLDPTGVDVLVVAGDLAPLELLPDALRLLCDHYKSADVVFVAGNHEFYGARPWSVSFFREEQLRWPNLHWLENSAVTIKGQRFVGCTLWFRESTAPRGLSDFEVIKDFEPWVYEQNARSVKYLEREVRRSDVVVTHHLPSSRSVALQYAGSSLNDYFVCDVERLIFDRQPALWLHGHTHASCKYALDATFVVCNPFGYARREENPDFNPRCIVEIG
jgi:Icc-related predicted phosphoesterase